MQHGGVTMAHNSVKNDSLTQSKFRMQMSTDNEFNAGENCKLIFVWLTDITGHTTTWPPPNNIAACR